MLTLLAVLLILALIGGVGIAAHALWIVLIAALILALLGGARGYRPW